jgi:hypothetical protein
MVVTSVEYPSFTHKLACTIGRTIVLAGAVSKGKSEIIEMTNVGIQKYFRKSVSFGIDHKLSMLSFFIIGFCSS